MDREEEITRLVEKEGVDSDPEKVRLDKIQIAGGVFLSRLREEMAWTEDGRRASQDVPKR